MYIIQYFLFLFLFYQQNIRCFIITRKNAINELAVCIKSKELKDTRKFQHSQIPIALPILSKLKLNVRLGVKLGLQLKTDLHHKFHLDVRSTTITKRKTKKKTIAVAATTNTKTNTKTSITKKNAKDTTSIPTKTKRPKTVRKRSKVLEALIQENEKSKKQSSVHNINNSYNSQNSDKFNSNNIDDVGSHISEVSNYNNVKLELFKTNTDSIYKYNKSDFVLKIKKTNNHIYATVIDKCKKNVVCTSSSLDMSLSSVLGTVKKTKTNRIINNGKTIKAAWEIGKDIARKAFEKRIFKVHFDRSGYKYNGRIEAFVEGARSVGLYL